ncbi:hypothetical protein RYX36_027597 [Vicia faba]
MNSSNTILPVLSLHKEDSELDAAALKVQKAYKSYKTRKDLADCAIIVEELWSKALEFAAIKRGSASFVGVEKSKQVSVSEFHASATKVQKDYKGYQSVSELDAAATNIQKVYKSYLTRRYLAECAVVVEELWWKALDFAA